MNISIELLKDLTMRYDYERGTYTEHEYEGLCVYEFICEQLQIESGYEHIESEEYRELVRAFTNE